MPRRTKPRSARNLLDFVAWVPWWAYALLALLCFVLCLLIGGGPASLALPAATHLAASLELQAFGASALVPVPAVLLALAALSASTRHSQRQRRRSAKGSESRVREDQELRDFERRVLEGFRAQGYQVVTPGVGADAARELTLRKERETYLVDCRHWRQPKVEVQSVQSLHHAIRSRGAAGGMVVTTGRFSREAQAYAGGCNIRLIGSAALQGLLK